MSFKTDRTLYRILFVMFAATVLLLASVGTASASHNRASQITWQATGTPGEVEVHVTFVARNSYYGGLEVGETFTDPTLEFGDGSTTDPSLEVVAVDEDRDILFSEATVSHTYANPAAHYEAALSSCCRISPSGGHINNPDGEYRIESLVTPNAGSSPVSSINPVINCHEEAVCEFSVSATSAHTGVLRWRLASAEEASGFSGGFVQPGPPAAPSSSAIGSTTGRYTWDANGAQLSSGTDGTFYSTQVIIEKLDALGDPVSSTAVDFFIRLSEDAPDLTPDCHDEDSNGDPDNDKDGLCDNWEVDGIDYDHDGTADLELYDADHNGTISSSEGADPNVKDAFVEIDYMDGLKPGAFALSQVEDAFANAPEPVRLHLVVDQKIPYSRDVLWGCTGTCPSGPSFNDLKGTYFGRRVRPRPPTVRPGWPRADGHSTTSSGSTDSTAPALRGGVSSRGTTRWWRSANGQLPEALPTSSQERSCTSSATASAFDMVGETTPTASRTISP